MLNTLVKVFNNGYKIAGLLAVIIGLIIPLVIKSCEASGLAQENIDLQNRVAKKSKLEVALVDAQNANFTLKERNSFLEDDNDNLRVSNKSVLKRLKETDSKLLAYGETNSTLTIENKKLWGILQDTTGGAIAADFEDLNPYYSFIATAFIYPETYLDLSLVVYDSTYFGIREGEDGTVGFIGHSNPLIEDKGAMFLYHLEEIAGERRSNFGYRFGLGPAWDGQGKFTLAVQGGVRFWKWGLAGFIAGDNKGAILTRDF